MVLHSQHSIVIDAPVDQVYSLIADVTRWPVIFAPTVYAEHIERDESSERFRIWALANGAVKNWSSYRTLDPAARVITFEQEVSQPPVASMGGIWSFTATAEGRTEVVLGHHFTAVDDDPDGIAWITKALDTNSASELAGLRAAAEVGAPVDDLVFTFADSVRVNGPLEAAYRFIDEADRWPARLPHVQRLDLRVDDTGVQHMSMDTLAPDGSTHTTSSVRVCLAGRAIMYKQIEVPALLTGHSGRWMFEQEGDATTVTSEHTVAIKPAAIPAVLGAGKTITHAKAFVRAALGGNSMITLQHAKEFSEAEGAELIGR